MLKKHLSAVAALQTIIPMFEARNFRWVIGSGFACYVYGIERELTDIDIDFETSKDEPAFATLLAELEPFITSPLEHFVDQNYDNYNFEVTIEGQLLDLCPMAELKIIDAESGTYKQLYSNGFPAMEWQSFEGLLLPLQAKHEVLREKESRTWKRDTDLRDIVGLKRLIAAEQP